MKARSRMALFALTGCLALPAPTPAFGAEYDDLETAEKSESSNGNQFGIGIEAFLSGLFASTPTIDGIPLGGGPGVTFIFDAQQFRIEGVLSLLFVEDSAIAFGLGGRFLWVLHSTSRSDLAAGAGIGISHHSGLRGNEDATLFHAEGLVQIRFFVVSNVAIHGGLGLGIAVGDGPTILSIGGQLNGQLGLSYFF